METALNLADELERNSFNLRQLFEIKFEACIDRQQGLLLNAFKDKESKRLLLEYMSNPIVAQFYKDKIRSDPVIEELHRCQERDLREGPNANIVDQKYGHLLNHLAKKEKDDRQSLTLYTDYIDLSQKIQKCFILKEKMIGDKDCKREETRSKSRCGLKMAVRDHDYFWHCEYCGDGFKKKSGLSSHLRTCPDRPREEESQNRDSGTATEEKNEKRTRRQTRNSTHTIKKIKRVGIIRRPRK